MYIFLLIMFVTVWIGGEIFFSLMAAPSIFKVLSREKAGEVVGAIFPKYNFLGYIGSLGIFLSLSLVAGGLEYTLFSYETYILSLVMLFNAWFNGLVINKKARMIKDTYRNSDDEAEVKRLKSQFAKIHRISMILNGLNIIFGVLFIWSISGGFWRSLSATP